MKGHKISQIRFKRAIKRYEECDDDGWDQFLVSYSLLHVENFEKNFPINNNNNICTRRETIEIITKMIECKFRNGVGIFY
jgi:hypothetical protein